ncbi:hypothetical protein J6TS7_16950 [Paenibacillus dendritiformis]|nr:hypothetical protein J6TS7_16950 [Paenibacillus dendritiformis]
MNAMNLPFRHNVETAGAVGVAEAVVKEAEARAGGQKPSWKLAQSSSGCPMPMGELA